MTSLLVRLFIRNADAPGDPKVRAAYGNLASVTGIVCNFALVAGKFAAGLLSGSISIMADAVNNLSDASASVITLIGFKLAQKPADAEHPYGHARFEYIAGLVVAVLVMAIGINLAISSVEKIMAPTPVDFDWLTFGILGASIVIKLWMAAFNRNIGRRIGSTALQATFADSRNDVIATAAVLAAAIVARLTGLNLDGWMGLAVAAFILVSGFFLVRETLNPILGTAPSPELVGYINKKIMSYDGVLATHDLIVHDYGPSRRFASAHVEMACETDVLKSHDTIDDIERDFLENDHINLILHYDPVVTGDEAVKTARGLVAKTVREVDPRLTIHDFRMVDGPGHTNYIFDVVVPPDFATPGEALKREIQRAVQRASKGKTVYTVVTVDASFAPIPH